MRTVFIFHGTASNPKGNWFPWLKEQLESPDCRVFVPTFPTPDGESLSAWLGVFDGYRKFIDENTIFVGHSKGGLFLLRILERVEKPVNAAFFVGAPIGIKPIKFYDEDTAFSGGFDFDWQKIKSNAHNFFVYHSDNDPYVCLENGQQLSKNLGVRLTFIPHAGHLNAESGYTTFPQLLAQISGIK